jgi:hypothetical protein
MLKQESSIAGVRGDVPNLSESGRRVRRFGAPVNAAASPGVETS